MHPSGLNFQFLAKASFKALLMTLSSDSLCCAGHPSWLCSLTASLKRKSTRAAACQQTPAGLLRFCGHREQLTLWALLTMLRNVPPSCCVVMSIWRSSADKSLRLSDLFSWACYTNAVTQVCPITAS